MKLLKGLLLVVMGFMLWGFLADRQLLSALVLLLAICLLIPWTRNWMIRQLPLLAKSPLRYGLWIVLFLGSCSLMEPTGEFNSLSICHQLQQGQCPSTPPIFFAKSPQLYLTGASKHLREGDELKVTLQKQREGGQPQDWETLKVKPSLAAKSAGNLQPAVLEVQPPQLPAGDYVAKIESSRRFKAITQKFSVWDVAMNQPLLCTEPLLGRCGKDAPALVKEQDKIYVSALGENVKPDLDVDWSLQYTSEMGKTKVLDHQTTQATVSGEQVLLPIRPSSLPVGSYELTLSSPQKRFEARKKQFTVWNSAGDAAARSGDQLPASRASLGKLMLCDRSGQPAPPEDPPQEVTDPKTGKVTWRKRKPKYDRTFCTKNVEEFASGATALGFQLDLANVAASTPVKVTWLYNGAEQSSVDELSPDTGGLTYTLSGNGGFPPGDYGVVISLETKGSQPIYRPFKVK
jgi:hypothetical protein